MSGTVPTVAAPLDPDLLPVLHEHLVLDLVNTRYRRGDVVLDFLATPAHVSAWVAAVAPPWWRGSMRMPGSGLRNLRDAVREVLEALLDRSAPPARHVETINGSAARIAVAHTLATRGGALVRVERTDREPEDRALALLARDVVDFAASPGAALLARCARPGCSMLMLRTHHLRRYCTPACAHLDRQHRYLRARDSRAATR